MLFILFLLLRFWKVQTAKFRLANGLEVFAVSDPDAPESGNFFPLLSRFLSFSYFHCFCYRLLPVFLSLSFISWGESLKCSPFFFQSLFYFFCLVLLFFFFFFFWLLLLFYFIRFVSFRFCFIFYHFLFYFILPRCCYDCWDRELARWT